MPNSETSAFDIPPGSRLRVEDDRFLTGRGRYVSDLILPNETVAQFVRSTHAHANIISVETTDARALPGVLAVYTGEDIVAAGLGGIPALAAPTGAKGQPALITTRPLLATDRVRFVGEEIAVVVAESNAAAEAAVEAVYVEYEALDAVCDAKEALRADAPLLHAHVPGNLCLDWEAGDAERVDEAFANAAHVVELSLHNNRVVVCPMETRAAVGRYDGLSETYTLFAGTQGVHLIRDALAKHVFGVPAQSIRVVTPDVGGAFGTKIWLYAEYALVLWAARQLDRPVKWISGRSEAFQSDTHGRDRHSSAALALDKDGKIRGLRVSNVANLGAYCSNFGVVVPTVGSTRALVGPYALDAVHVRTRVAYTNTVPTDAYRGAGRPEYSYLMERLVDVAARDIGFDRWDLRARNLIGSDDMPYETPLGTTYDSGNFRRAMSLALENADWVGFPARARSARERGKRRGIGLALYVEPSGGRRDQPVQLNFEQDGTLNVDIGSQSTGQGHETMYSAIAATYLGLAPSRLRIHQGDTARLDYGRGTSGSRSTTIGGSALLMAVKEVAQKGLVRAAEELEASDTDIVFEQGRYTVKGTDRTIGFEDVLALMCGHKADRDASQSSLDSSARFEYEGETYPNGCHVVEVEVDPETGALIVERYTAVDDFGRLINPMLVEGQVHGGIAQGIGQAMTEGANYEAHSGQLLSGSFMDYAFPRADDLPAFNWQQDGTPCQTNPLGVKGCGEAGCMASPAAFINALVDALAEYEIRDIAMPATPQVIWQAIHRPGVTEDE